MLYSSEPVKQAEKNRQGQNRAINLINGSNVPTRPLKFVKAEPKRSVKREQIVNNEPKERRDERVTVKHERSVTRGKSRSRSPGAQVSRNDESPTLRSFTDHVEPFRGYSHEEVRVLPLDQCTYYAEDLCCVCIRVSSVDWGPREEKRRREATMSYATALLEFEGWVKPEQWADMISHDLPFASHELCLRCGVRPADAVPCPQRLSKQAIRTVRKSIETEVKTGAYDVLNTASVAMLYGREDGPSDASRERIQGIHDELSRAIVHVEEYLEGPTVWEKRNSESIYKMPQWEMASLNSQIGAPTGVKYTQKMEQPSARSYNGDSFAERARRGRAFGKSGKGGKGNVRDAPGHFQDLQRRGKAEKATGANAIPLGRRRRS